MSSLSTSTRIGHSLAKALGIKLQYRHETGVDKISRGESVFSVSSADTYTEDEPTTAEWFAEYAPTRRGILRYILSLFPFTSWILHYNTTWLWGDLTAGITIGAVVVPQGMAYAKLAELPVQFGLYAAFMGTLTYWIFATSKDITIGPVAVMSTIVGTVVLESQKTLPDVSGHVIASAMAIIAGSIVTFIGLIRVGWIVDFISLTAVCAFITGSALSIGAGQVPGLLGISSTYVNNRNAFYLVVINTLKNLKHTKLDAAMGLTALLMLYLIRFGCSTAAKRYPKHKKFIFFCSTLRTVFVILLYTMISWLVNREHMSKPSFQILGTVPRGFQNAAAPTVNASIIRSFASQIPATVIVLVIEHISIAKSFGRINNYTINPSQELLAIGVTNLLGPFLGAYPATGSFSRTAIQSKAGVRSPLAGVITAIVVLLAMYALTAVFFYIPNAVLSAVIIHAVGDLITPPNTVYQFWRISPLEVIIFFAGVFVTVFSSIENGVYTTICISAALLLFRVAKARGNFLGRVKVRSVLGDHLVDGIIEKNGKANLAVRKNTPESKNADTSIRNVFLPLDHQDGSNPSIELSRPYPGIFVYRFSEGYNYPNASHYLDYMVSTIFRETRRTDSTTYAKPGDRPWNDPGPRKGRHDTVDYSLPTLKAIILDFSSVNNVDVTSVQHMIDVRNQLDRYASPNTVEWHIACINNRWTKRALTAAGFGYPTPEDAAGEFRRWKPIFSVAEMGGNDSAAAEAEARDNVKRTVPDIEARPLSGSADSSSRRASMRSRSDSNEVDVLELEISKSRAYGGGLSKERAQAATRVAVVHGLNRPLFHIDLTSALQSAIASVERRQSQPHQEPEPHEDTVG